MGKRRTNLNHKTRFDDDDESDEEIIEETSSDENQKTDIQSRKKLVAKRKIGSGTSTSTTPSPFSFFTKPSAEENVTPSVFSGFKGFTAFKPISEITSSTPSSSTESTTSMKFSLEKKDTTENKIDSSLPNGTKSETTLSAKPNSIGSDLFGKQNTDSDKQESLPKNKNISENELRFITELNDLYERCYGTSKRSYKLPIEMLNESGESSDQETKYACLLAELNRHISKWISKHVEESPLVLLTPVFVDYFNYLILLEKNFFPGSFKKSDKEASEKLTNGTKLPINGTNGHKEKVEKPDVIIEDKAKENQDVFDSNKKTPSFFKSANQPFTPISLDTNTTFKFGSVTSIEEEKSSLFKKSTPTENKEPQKTSLLSSEPILTKIDSFAKPVEEKKTEASPAKNIFPSFGNTSSVSFFKFGSAQSTTSESDTTKNVDSTEKKEDKKPENESNKFSFNSTASGFISSFKKNAEEVNTEKIEEKKQEDESKKFSFGQAQQGIFSSLKKSEDESKEKSSDSLTFKPITSTPFSFSLASSAASSTTSLATKTSFTFNSDKSSIFSSTLGGETKNLFGSTPSPFGSGITFGAGAPAVGGDAEGEEEPYEPPKPESSNVKEEGSVYEKRMKLYYYNEEESKFVDRGIGNLFIKPIKDGESTQLIIRADTSLANILLNVKLSKVFPITKIGPKDVSYVCVPHPEIPGVSSTNPCKFLFKVKTPEDAEELLEKLNEHKK